MDDYKAEEAISKAEERFEKYRKTVTLFLGPVVFAIILFTPVSALSTQAHRLFAVLGLVLIYWIGEPIPIPVTALMGPVLCAVLGVAGPKVVFAPFSHPVIFLFIGSFMLAEAMKSHRLDYRISLGILSTPWVGSSYLRVFLAIAVIPTVISMWISDSATTAMIYPITVGIAGAVSALAGNNGRSRFTTGLLLTIAYAALIGGIGTPIGTPPNLIAVGMIDKLAGVKILFFQWMLMAMPIMIVMFIAMAVYMFVAHRPLSREITGLKEYIDGKKAGLGPWTKGQKNTLAAFCIAVALWTAPGVAITFFGGESVVYRFLEEHLREEVVSLIAVMVLFLTPVDWAKRKFTISWSEAVSIDWGTIILFGGGLSLGELMFSTGLAGALGGWIVQATGVNTLWSITAVATALAIIITEVTSNTATANMLVPLIISVASGAGVSPVPPAIGVALGASMAFMLPVSTPSNAIVYGSGLVPITSMIKAGVVLDVISFAVILAGLRIMCPVLGLV